MLHVRLIKNVLYLLVFFSTSTFSLTVDTVLEKVPQLANFKQNDSCWNFSTLPGSRVRSSYYIQYAIYMNTKDADQALYDFAKEHNLLDMKPQISRMTSMPRAYFFFPSINPATANLKDMEEHGGHFNLSFTFKDGAIPAENDLPTLKDFLEKTELKRVTPSHNLWMTAEEKPLSFEHEGTRYTVRYVYFDPDNKNVPMGDYIKMIKGDR
ncbi:MAG: hypothetical protein K2X53_00215, partial [Alphaproteobacteria bacterium]|nr:hypothetical protein [Alphaproteobacteria bacterium]